MKNTLTTLILFLPFLLFCQGVDTSYTSIRKGLNPRTGDSAYYETYTIIYADGSVDADEEIVGDISAVISRLYNRAKNQASRFADYANEVWQKERKYVSPILQANTLLTTLFDTSLVEISVDRYGSAVDGTTWDITSDLGNFTGIMTIAPSGNSLRMQIGGQAYTLLPVGDAWIRFQNFPPGGYTDLHRKLLAGKLEFRSVDESLIIRRQ